MDLTDAYANAAHILDAAAYPTRWAREAAAYRERLAVAGRFRPGLMYGHGSREALDLFLPEAVPLGLMVFVHGGYWLKFDRSLWSHLAAGAVERGWAVAMPSYDLCPRVRISDITRQVAQAVSVAAQEVAGPLRLVGHSAGGHLVARILAPDLMQTELNADLKLDQAEAEAESPIQMAPPEVPVTVWVGGAERPAFLDQARWLSDAWGCGHVVAEGSHHFDVIEPLADSASEMVARLLA